ncbi:uncharacterized protein CBL_06212 [Carabus blaptoides fortunei]
MYRLLLTILCAVVFCASTEVPEFIHLCKINDPEFIECIKKSAEALKPIFAKGAPDYNIPSLEPLIMDELISEQSGGLHITAKNVKAYGASNYFFKDLKIDMDSQRYDIDVELPNLGIEADYGVDGKVILVPIRGSGPMTANVTDILAKVVLIGEITEIDGEKHLNFKTMTINVKVGGGSGKLYNLFNGDKVLGDIVNDTINKNFDAFLKELLPVIERSLASVFLKIANSIVSPYTFAQLFPEN